MSDEERMAAARGLIRPKVQSDSLAWVCNSSTPAEVGFTWTSARAAAIAPNIIADLLDALADAEARQQGIDFTDDMEVHGHASR